MNNSQGQSEAHRDSLLDIARARLGIDSFDMTGKPTTDIRLVRVCAVEDALEDAYYFGLMMGHNVSRASYRLSNPVALDSEVERDWVRAAASDILRRTGRR